MQLDKGLTWTGLVVQSHAALLPSQLEIDVPGDVPGLQELPRQSLSVCLSVCLTASHRSSVSPVQKTLVVSEKLKGTILPLLLLLNHFQDNLLLPRILYHFIYNAFKSR